jgi:hypothetical protein
MYYNNHGSPCIVCIGPRLLDTVRLCGGENDDEKWHPGETPGLCCSPLSLLYFCSFYFIKPSAVAEVLDHLRNGGTMASGIIRRHRQRLL